MSYVPDAIGGYGMTSYVPPAIGGFGGGLGPSYVPPPSFGGYGLEGGVGAFGFGGVGNVADVPGRIYEVKEQQQAVISNRSNQAREHIGAITAARQDMIDRQADHQIHVQTAQTNARRQAAKLQAQNVYQQQHSAIDRQQMVHHTNTEQKAQAAANRAQQQITHAQLQAQHADMVRNAPAAHHSAVAGHAANA